MRQTMTTKVRLNEGKAKNCSAMRSATDCLGRSQHPSRAAVVARSAETLIVVFVRATIWGISAEKSFARGNARSKATVPVVCRQAAFNNTVNRGHRERVLP
jgi:hypothetical protein